MFVKKSKLSLCVAMVATLAGCGGSSSPEEPEVIDPVLTTPTPIVAETVSLTGKVIDGYVSGATVWLDLDGDNKFDKQTEPSVVSTESGDYIFEFTEEQASCVPYSTMYVDVPVGAIDEDLGVVTEAYQMSFPPSIEPLSDDEIRNISPLTSVMWGQLRRQLQGSGKGNLSCAELKADTELRLELKGDIEDVMLNLVAHYNLSADQIYSDFIANNDSAAYDKAQSIVTGLKAAYKHKKALEIEYPNAAEIRVVIYQDKVKDEEYSFNDAWYRDEIIFMGTEDFIEFVKLTDTGSLNKVDVVLTKLHELGETWGDQSLKGWLSIREDVYINEDHTYRCGNIERVSFEKDGIHYELGNTIPTVNFPTLNECINTSLENPDERSFSLRYAETDYEYGAEFNFRDMNADFQTLSNWIDVKGKAADLNPEELFTAFDVMPYRFDDEVAIDVSYWRKSKATGDVVIHKNNEGKWRKETKQDDGTTVYECGIDGTNWGLCS
ncbi:hypothetical protein CXF85_21650 [Colwellia sp. 75C3]|uniref:hypothetical protein n=1 Tax=Colwellia sp. 75C3 TaxID=888425 RepID=UPI000C332BB5|nr:hypothetical protein [Colwellia sp. 75C3]PKG80723.1 hypothetical protein CXF85_21650 [Colwellia sp. 75C3]